MQTRCRRSHLGAWHDFEAVDAELVRLVQGALRALCWRQTSLVRLVEGALSSGRARQPAAGTGHRLLSSCSGRRGGRRRSWCLLGQRLQLLILLRWLLSMIHEPRGASAPATCWLCRRRRLAVRRRAPCEARLTTAAPRRLSQVERHRMNRGGHVIHRRVCRGGNYFACGAAVTAQDRLVPAYFRRF